MLYEKNANSTITIAFLPALPVDGRMFEPQIEAFRDQATIYAADYPGFRGLSVKPNLTVEGYAKEILSEWDTLGITRAHVVGVSLGGQLALWLAAHHPERVESLVLSSTHSMPSIPEEKQMFLNIAQAAETQSLDALAGQFIGMLLPEEIRESKPHVVEKVKAMILSAENAGLAAAFRALAARPDPTPWIASVQVPTLLIYGELDQAIPAQHLDALKKNLGASTTRLLRTGHYPNLEDPEAYNALLKEFIFSRV